MALYKRFKINDFTLRDYLALERTIMSNERTLLAYARTGTALLIAGVTGMNYFTESAWVAFSIIAAVAGALVFVFGVWRFIIIRGRLNLASPDETADVTAQHVSETGPAN